MADGPEKDDSSLQQVSDPEEYVNHRRLKTIFDIRDQMRELQNEVKVAPHVNNTSRYEALSAYRAIVSSYIVEVEPLMRHYKPGPKLLDKRDFGTVKIGPSVVERKSPMGRGSTTAYIDTSTDSKFKKNKFPVKSVPAPVEFKFHGLTSLLGQPDPLASDFKIQSSRSRRNNTRTHTVTSQVPFEKLDGMTRTINNFLADIGMEVDPEESQETLTL